MNSKQNFSHATKDSELASESFSAEHLNTNFQLVRHSMQTEVCLPSLVHMLLSIGGCLLLEIMSPLSLNVLNKGCHARDLIRRTQKSDARLENHLGTPIGSPCAQNTRHEKDDLGGYTSQDRMNSPVTPSS